MLLSRVVALAEGFLVWAVPNLQLQLEQRKLHYQPEKQLSAADVQGTTAVVHPSAPICLLKSKLQGK